MTAEMTPQNATGDNVAVGMGAAAGAFLMFTIMNVFAKYLSAGHSVIEIAFYRNLVACMPFLILTFGFGRREILIIRSQPRLIAIRAVLGTLTLILPPIGDGVNAVAGEQHVFHGGSPLVIPRHRP